MKIKGLIFDFDGLLVNTESPQLHAWQSIYRSFGVDLRLDEWVQCLGTSADAFDPIVDLRSKTTATFDADEVKASQRHLLELAIGKEKLRPGMETILQQAQQMSLRMAVASSSNQLWVQTGLERVNASRYFHTVCTANDVTKVKPDPELFILALNRLGLDQQEVIVFEDSPNGIRAAKSAGLTCVAYPNEISVGLNLSSADVILPNLPDYTLAAIINLVDGK